MSAPAETQWEEIARPHRLARWATIAAVLVVIGHFLTAMTMHGTRTGVNFRFADQAALVVIGFLVAGVILCLRRPRLWVGPAGVRVRGPFGTRSYPWSVVQGLAFPEGKSWARLELPSDEFTAVFAIQSTDKELAVASMHAFREAQHRWDPDAALP